MWDSLVSEFVIDTGGFKIPISDAFGPFDSLVDAHIVCGYLDPLGVQEH